MFRTGLFSVLPFLSFGQYFEEPEKGEGGGAKPEEPKKEAPRLVIPAGAVFFETQDAFDAVMKERVDRAKTKAEEDARTAEAARQGDFKKIVDEEYIPLKTRFENDVTPELERWRSLATTEVKAIADSLPADLKDLMPDTMPLDGQLAWLRKAQRRADAEKGAAKKEGNNPKDPPVKGSERDSKLEQMKRQMGLNPLYKS